MGLNRTWSRAFVALAMVGTAAACSSSDSKKDPDDGGTNMETDAAPTADAGRDTGAPSMDGGDAGNVSTDAGRDAARDSANPGTTPVLGSAKLRQVGRFGHDLRIDVVGTDTDGDAVAVRLELFDANGAGVPIADTNDDGTPDTGVSPIALSTPLAKAANSAGFALMPLFWRQHQDVRRAKLSLVDDHGNISNELEVQLDTQAVLALGGTCDPNYLDSRCQDGLGCKGALPSTCQAGEKPVITRAGYYSDERGPRVLIEGTDPDDDVNSYKIEFLDLTNKPVFVDLDMELGDQPPVSSFTTQVDVTAGGGKFFFRFDPTENFLDLVKRVRLSVTDLGNVTSATIDKTLNDTDTAPSSTGAPVRQAGQACDARAFDRCTTNAVCTLATATANAPSCLVLTTARQRACTAALVLNPFNGVTQVRGEIKDPSLWDSPTGCAPNDPKYQAENIVKLTLTRPASKVVITTNNPYTSFDTTLYAIAKCDATPTDAWCADDSASGNRAELELTGSPLPAQDYFVIVDSFPDPMGSVGKTFQVDVTVTE